MGSVRTDRRRASGPLAVALVVQEVADRHEQERAEATLVGMDVVQVPLLEEAREVRLGDVLGVRSARATWRTKAYTGYQ